MYDNWKYEEWMMMVAFEKRRQIWRGANDAQGRNFDKDVYGCMYAIIDRSWAPSYDDLVNTILIEILFRCLFDCHVFNFGYIINYISYTQYNINSDSYT